MIRALVVDDEPRAVDQLVAILESLERVEVIGTARDVGDAERFLLGRTPDVVFLDIDMPGRLGFALVPSVPATTRIVFVTAHEDRALEAFRVGAVDYVLKPVDRDRLALTIDRLRGWLPAATPADDSREPTGRKAEHLAEATDAPGAVRLVLAGGRGTETVLLSDIAWVEAVRNYTRVQAGDRDPILVRRTMSEWEASLEGAAFGRISRSLFVQLAAVRSTQWQSRDQTLVFFRGVAAPLPIGRIAVARLKELLPR